MSDIHIDDFYRDTAKILVFLYNQFPRKTTLYVEDICGSDSPDEFGLHSLRHQSCFNTMIWLARHDYLHFDQAIRQEALDQVVLSHRGLLTLDDAVVEDFSSNPLANNDEIQPAVNMFEQKLWIHHLRQELRSGTSLSLTQSVRHFMKHSRHLGDVPTIR